MKKKEPIPKVVAAALGAAAVTVLNAVLYETTGYDPTPLVVGAEVTLAAFAAGWLKNP